MPDVFIHMINRSGNFLFSLFIFIESIVDFATQLLIDCPIEFVIKHFYCPVWLNIFFSIHQSIRHVCCHGYRHTMSIISIVEMQWMDEWICLHVSFIMVVGKLKCFFSYLQAAASIFLFIGDGNIYWIATIGYSKGCGGIEHHMVMSFVVVNKM